MENESLRFDLNGTATVDDVHFRYSGNQFSETKDLGVWLGHVDFSSRKEN